MKIHVARHPRSPATIATRQPQRQDSIDQPRHIATHASPPPCHDALKVPNGRSPTPARTQDRPPTAPARRRLEQPTRGHAYRAARPRHVTDANSTPSISITASYLATSSPSPLTPATGAPGHTQHPGRYVPYATCRVTTDTQNTQHRRHRYIAMMTAALSWPRHRVPHRCFRTLATDTRRQHYQLRPPACPPPSTTVTTSPIDAYHLGPPPRH